MRAFSDGEVKSNFLVLVVILCFMPGICNKKAISKCHPFKASANKASYMRFVNKKWDIYPCPPGTVWSEKLCICSNTPNVYCRRDATSKKLLPENNTDLKRLNTKCKHKDVNLVWSVRLCHCVWKRKPKNFDPVYDPAKCEGVLHIEFKTNPPADTNFIFIQPVNPLLIEIVTDCEANDLVATYLPASPLTIPALNGNDLSDAFRVNVRFRIDKDIQYLENKHVVVFSNNCPSHPNTFSLSYRPIDQQYRVTYLNDKLTPTILQCSYVAGSAYSWKAVFVLLQDNLVHLFVNNKPCGSKQKASVETMGRFRCPLTIGGSVSRVGDGPFFGFFDHFFLVRRCKVKIPEY